MKQITCGGCGKKLAPGTTVCSACHTRVPTHKTPRPPVLRGAVPPTSTLGIAIADELSTRGAARLDAAKSEKQKDYKTAYAPKPSADYAAPAALKERDADENKPRLSELIYTGDAISPSYIPAAATTAATYDAPRARYGTLAAVLAGVVLLIQIFFAVSVTAEIADKARLLVLSKLNFSNETYLQFARTDEKKIPVFTESLDFVKQNPNLAQDVAGYIAAGSMIMAYETRLAQSDNADIKTELTKKIRIQTEAKSERLDDIASKYALFNKDIGRTRSCVYVPMMFNIVFGLLVCVILAGTGTKRGNLPTRILGAAASIVAVGVNVASFLLAPELTKYPTAILAAALMFALYVSAAVITNMNAKNSL